MATYINLAENLRAKAVELDNTLKMLASVNNDIKDRCEKAITALQALTRTNPCSVCCETKLSHAFVPCGHCFCENCSVRGLRRGRCFTCRGTIERTMKVYF